MNAEKFLQHVTIGEPHECWLWTGAKNSKGYGHLRVGGVVTLAHRLVYEFANGPIPEGLHILHACDTPACINPHHLRAGTHQDNMRDCYNKRRHAFGERNGHSKLTDSQVTQIRRSYVPGVVTMAQLAARFGTSKTNVHAILHGNNWKHISAIAA